MPQLIIRADIGQLTAHELAGGRVTIGRQPDNTVVLTSGTVSGHHAEIVLRGNGFRLVDLCSANGTSVNGQAVNTVTLRNNDHIQFGGVRATFNCEEVAQAATHLPKKQSWAILAGALAIIAGVSYAYKSISMSRFHSPDVTNDAHHQGAIAKADRVTNLFPENFAPSTSLVDAPKRNATTSSTKPVESMNSKGPSSQENQDIQDAITAFCEYASEGGGSIKSQVGWDESKGTLAIFHQPPMQIPQLVKFLVGDLDPAKTEVRAEPSYHVYSVSFYNPEDARFISLLIRRNGKDETLSDSTFTLFFADELVAQKVARAINFLSEQYARRGFKSPVLPLNGVELLNFLVTKVHPSDSITVDSGVFTYAERLQNGSTVTRTVKLADLDPERFSVTTNNDAFLKHRKRISLACISKQTLINVSSDALVSIKSESSVSFSVANDNDADRFLKTVTEFCVQHGWKPSRF